MPLQAEIKDGAKIIATLDLDEKKFRTGSRGFHGQDKVRYEGKRYQCNLLLVEIGSKPKKKGHD